MAVHQDPEGQPVRRFAAFTEDLQQLADWQRCGVTTAAMESTGVYWIPLHEILDQRGLQPCVIQVFTKHGAEYQDYLSAAAIAPKN